MGGVDEVNVGFTTFTGISIVRVGDRESSTTRLRGPGSGNWCVMI